MVLGQNITLAINAHNADYAVVYLRELPPAKPLEIRYRLRATMPVKVTARPARAYEYYDPDKKAASVTTLLTVVAR